jgi:hypothetical protein
LIAELPPDLVQRIETIARNQHLCDRIQPFIAGRAVYADKRAQGFIIAEDFFDNEVKRRGLVASRGPYQATQPLAILRGVPQAVDMIEPQPVEPVFRDHPGDQPVRRRKGPGVLDPQARQRVDVEEAAIVDITRCQTPVRDPVVLPLQEVVEGEVLSGAPGPGTVGLKPAFDDLRGPFDRLQLRLEGRSFHAVGTMKPGVAGGQIEYAGAGERGFRPCFLNERAQNLAVAFG